MTYRIGFIGLGLMGRGIAKSILRNGGTLTVLGHRDPGPVLELVSQGARQAADLSDLASSCDFVFMCVPGSHVVEELVRGPQGFMQVGRAGLTLIDCSTSDPASTLSLAEQLEPLGMTLLDAPLGGTPTQAESGTLAAFVGCDAALWQQIAAVVRLWSAKAVRVGEVGDGHRLKLLMNFLSLGYAALYSEMLSIGRKAGLTPQTIDQGIRGSRMDCGVYQTFFRWVLDRDREAHRFTLRNAHKDMRYLRAMAREAGVRHPIGTAVTDYFARAEESGHGDDFVPMLSDIAAAANDTSLTQS
jgi:3-hydroxyisobutyrate dehydrogenase-like beta-hydroxyacid dehydrogenase